MTQVVPGRGAIGAGSSIDAGAQSIAGSDREADLGAGAVYRPSEALSGDRFAQNDSFSQQQLQDNGLFDDVLVNATGTFNRAASLLGQQAKALGGGSTFELLVGRLWCCGGDPEDRRYETQDGAPVSQYVYDDEPLQSGVFPTILAQKEAQSLEAGSKPPTPTGVTIGRTQLFREHQWQPGGVLASLIGQGTSGEQEELMESPEVELEGGARYKGQWLGDERHGKGVLTASDGQKYEGQFRHNMAHGRGCFIEADGSRYEGQWQEDQKHGHGTYLHADGTTFEGQWQQDAKSGTGTEYWADAQYQGEFLFGFKHGVGIYKSNKGVEYEGQFRDDNMDGEGCYKFAGGKKYFGQWHNGHMSGRGRMEWPNGSLYDGGFEKDMKSGDGTFTWPDGKRYTGQWMNGKQHGKGVSEDADGRRTEGVWDNGELVPALDPPPKGQEGNHSDDDEEA